MRRHVLLLSGALIAASPAAAQQIVKHEPPQGQMRRGEIVLVDNGKCPKGQLQEVTGGSGGPAANRSAPRTRRCVPRP